jgi:hypothetical protein
VGKHSSLLRTFVNFERKNLTLGPSANVIKKLFVIDVFLYLAIVFVRLSRKSLPGANTCLLRTLVNYGRKKFCNIGHGGNVIKLFCSYLRIFVLSYCVC